MMSLVAVIALSSAGFAGGDIELAPVPAPLAERSLQTIPASPMIWMALMGILLRKQMWMR